MICPHQVLFFKYRYFSPAHHPDDHVIQFTMTVDREIIAGPAAASATLTPKHMLPIRLINPFVSVPAYLAKRLYLLANEQGLRNRSYAKF